MEEPATTNWRIGSGREGRLLPIFYFSIMQIPFPCDLTCLLVSKCICMSFFSFGLKVFPPVKGAELFQKERATNKPVN
jgi:hypothetical protein